MLKTDIADVSENKLLCCQQIMKMEGYLPELLDLKLQQYFYYKPHFPRVYNQAIKCLLQDQFVGSSNEKNIKVHYKIKNILNFVLKLQILKCNFHSFCATP
jgi:hypothetical protein